MINATGVIVHTNLGRAPWPEAAIRAAREAAEGTLFLELDRATGRRGRRYREAEAHLVALTGAEDALIVTNNAAAVALAVGLAGRGGVAVSRGELVEIGGGVRIPEIVRRAGAKLVEVGTTNRTRASDFEAALEDGRARLVLRVHPSNFSQAGFVEAPDAPALAAAAHRLGALVVDDLGSGALLDTAAFGLAHEPMPSERLADGADLVTFSGDKLVGGPQAGFIVGRADLVARLRKDPLARAMRPDKVVLAAVAATLALYRAGVATRDIPVWRQISAPVEALSSRAAAIAEAAGARASVAAVEATIGGGSLPGEVLPSRAVCLSGRQAGPVARPPPCRYPGRGRSGRARGRAARPALGRPGRRRGACRRRSGRRWPAMPEPTAADAGRSVVIGTAGHIDHGKTSLLRALTGIDADRLPEERRRGMTIDVGYAHVALPDGSVVDFVDVPGHDRLVGNMLVGAGEIDAALLVVAADDGPNAQTLEHLGLLDALGIRDGLAVVTKADLVDEARLASVEAEVRALLATTTLAGSPVLAASATNGTGIDGVLEAVAALARRLGARDAAAEAHGPRLAIDRVFAVKGRGTVVTGSLRGGAVTTGMTLRLVPGDEALRVREVQVRGAPVTAVAGGRTALLVGGIEGDRLRRGQVLTTDPGVVATSRILVAMRGPARDPGRTPGRPRAPAPPPGHRAGRGAGGARAARGDRPRRWDLGRDPAPRRGHRRRPGRPVRPSPALARRGGRRGRRARPVAASRHLAPSADAGTGGRPGRRARRLGAGSSRPPRGPPRGPGLAPRGGRGRGPPGAGARARRRPPCGAPGRDRPAAPGAPGGRRPRRAPPRHARVATPRRPWPTS